VVNSGKVHATSVTAFTNSVSQQHSKEFPLGNIASVQYGIASIKLWRGTKEESRADHFPLLQRMVNTFSSIWEVHILMTCSSNMLYPKEDPDTHRLQFACRTCQFSEEAASSCVFRNVLNNAVGETAGVTQDVGSDPTVRLPSF
jgi:hypothetical protein